MSLCHNPHGEGITFFNKKKLSAESDSAWWGTYLNQLGLEETRQRIVAPGVVFVRKANKPQLLETLIENTNIKSIGSIDSSRVRKCVPPVV